MSKAINQIRMYGSHDSGTYGITACSKIMPNITKWAHVVPCIVAAVSKCQKLNIMEQLDAGIRFFDLRIAQYQGEQWLQHGMYSIRLSDAFVNVSKWLDNHPTEIIILLVRFDTKPYDSNPLVSMIGLNHIAFYPEFNPNTPVNQFYDKNKRCIIITDDNVPNKYPLWPYSQVICNVWPNKQTVKTLKDWCDNHLKNLPTDKLHVLQLVLTPTFETVITGGIPKALAKEINKVKDNWLKEWTDKNIPLNIILIDWVKK